MSTIKPIVAHSTPSGSGALAIIRISGHNVRKHLAPIAKTYPAGALSTCASHTIVYGWITTQERSIDEVLFLVMDAPKTFTGEDTVEITCHNNPLIIQNIISACISCGMREAQPGEFTRRAFENGKLDLTQAEAINDLLSSQTQKAVDASLSQLQGSLSDWLASIEKRLVTALSWCEASFEFLEDEGDFAASIKNQLDAILEQISQAHRTFSLQQMMKDGFRIALLGSVNAGKSSLFNYLLNQPRAIVSDTAGTTRDAIEAHMYYAGNHWTLIDTAGLRTTHDAIEKEGIKRAFQEAHKADIILLAHDASRETNVQEQEIYDQLAQTYAAKIIHVATKTDKAHKQKMDGTKTMLTTSYHDPESYQRVCTAIQNKIDELVGSAEAPFLINKRHYNTLCHVEERIKTLRPRLSGEVQYELISHELNALLQDISSLTGKSVAERALDTVFREFCVGK